MLNVKFFITSLIILFAGFTVAQVHAQQEDVVENAVEGIVIDNATESALSGVEIKIEENGEAAETNAEGKFSISNLEPGTYTIVAEKDGYETWSQSVEVTEYETEIEIRLEPVTEG